MIDLTEHVGNLFIKEMAFMALPYLSTDFLQQFQHIFLVRNPIESFKSLKKIKPSFIESEWGVRDLYLLYQRICREIDPTPLVIDGQEICNDPAATLTKICNLVQIEYQESMLHWQKGDTLSLSAEDQLSHTRWHDTLRNSTGFIKKRPCVEIDCELSPEEIKMLKNATLYYERMREGLGG